MKEQNDNFSFAGEAAGYQLKLVLIPLKTGVV